MQRSSKQSYLFIVTIETSGMIIAADLVTEIGRCVSSVREDRPTRKTMFLFQWLYAALQMGNSVAFRTTFIN